MADLFRDDPTTRFSNLAEDYARSRPDYPAAAIEHILTRCGLASGSVLADVGCGTGISSRLFAAQGLRVIGIEPNEAMRRQAEQAVVPDGAAAPVFRAGKAEATGLADASVSAVLAAQAFHWFEPETTLREFHRILRPGGWVALMWNERDAADPFTAAFGKVVRGTKEAETLENTRAQAGFPLLANPLFQDGERAVFTHRQSLDLPGVLSRGLSVSYAPKEPTLKAQFQADLKAVFERFQKDGRATLHYETAVFTARRG